MIWAIEGADEKTGKDITASVDARDRQSAEYEARKRGMLPSTIKPSVVASPPQIAESTSMFESIRKIASIVCYFVTTIAILIITPIFVSGWIHEGRLVSESIPRPPNDQVRAAQVAHRLLVGMSLEDAIDAMGSRPTVVGENTDSINYSWKQSDIESIRAEFRKNDMVLVRWDQ